MDVGAKVAITFLAIIIVIMVLLIVLITQYKKRVERTSDPFPQVVRDAAVKAVPESSEFDMIVVSGVKDAITSAKGYERIQSGYDSLPNYIFCYRGDEIYIMGAKYSSRKSIDVDTDLILHFTKGQLQSVKIGTAGKILLFFKDSKRFFAMAAGKVVIAPQQEEYDSFMCYIKDLAAEVNG